MIINGSDIFANVLGGLVAAAAIGLISWCRNRRKHRILKELTEIMVRAIRHRNIGEKLNGDDETLWVQQANVIENEAIAKANELSSSAGSLVNWLDRVDPWKADSEVQRSISILSKVIERIRGLLERNS